jgi:hypothetical protein
VRKRFLARLKEDGDSVALRIDFAERDLLLELDPRAFYLTDHYRPYPAVLMRLKEVRKDMLERVIEEAWRGQDGERARATRPAAARRRPRT